jgi:molybdenum cofactor synthesis domain-containing protein
MPIDEGRTFLPVRIAVLTVSDTRTLADDRSGDTLVERLTGAGHVLADRLIVTDDRSAIVARLHAWIDDPQVDVILTTGGTGVTGRDVTPEALAQVQDMDIPGGSAISRSAPRPSSLAPPPASRAAPISSRCPVRPARSATPGTAFSPASSTAGSAPAISSS